MNDIVTFDNLLGNVLRVHEVTSTFAKGAVNQLLTVRNWMIGYYIVEFEQNGQNKATYGTHLLEDLASKIDVKGLDRQMLNSCRLFYLKYLRFARQCHANSKLHRIYCLADYHFLT